jgi:hypothetical protein
MFFLLEKGSEVIFMAERKGQNLNSIKFVYEEERLKCKKERYPLEVL